MGDRHDLADMGDRITAERNHEHGSHKSQRETDGSSREADDIFVLEKLPEM